MQNNNTHYRINNNERVMALERRTRTRQTQTMCLCVCVCAHCTQSVDVYILHSECVCVCALKRKCVDDANNIFFFFARNEFHTAGLATILRESCLCTRMYCVECAKKSAHSAGKK